MSEFQKIIANDTFGVKPVYLTITAANTPYQIGVNETIIIATTALADAAAILVLPSKAEAVGKFYYICGPTAASAGDLSIYDKEAGSEISTYGDMDADDDHAIFFTDGYKWRVALNGVA
jgi:hypothetical protein